MTIPGLPWVIAGTAILCLAALLVAARGQISGLEQTLSERDQKIERLTKGWADAEARHSRAMALVSLDAAALRARLVRASAIKREVDHAETGIVPAPIRAAIDGLRDADAGDSDDQDDDSGTAPNLRR